MTTMTNVRRYVCTPAAPWSPGDGPALHPDATPQADDWWSCPCCGVEFRGFRVRSERDPKEA